MDDDAGDEQAQDQPFSRRWTATSSYDVYMVDTPKEGDSDDEKDLVEDEPPEMPPKRQVSGAALNCVTEKIAIPEPETIILRRTPKTKKPPSNQHPNRMIGRTGKLTLMSQQGTRTRRIATIYHSPKTT